MVADACFQRKALTTILLIEGFVQIYCCFSCSLRSCLTRFSIINSWACSRGGGGNFFKSFSKGSSLTLTELFCFLSFCIRITLSKEQIKLMLPESDF